MGFQALSMTYGLVLSFSSVQKILYPCVDFSKWTNENKHEIQQYWHNKTKQLTADLKHNYKSDNCKHTYLKIRQFLIDFGCINNKYSIQYSS